MHNRIRMTIPATSNIYPGVSDAVLVGFGLVVAKEQQWRQEDLMANALLRNSSFDNTTASSNGDQQTDGELAHLLMPVWAYQSAAAYLICISVLGLFMNIVVILVIINDPQVAI
jgi:hypothetical protein